MREIMWICAAALALASCASVPFNPPDPALHADVCAVLSQFEAVPGSSLSNDEALWKARGASLDQQQAWHVVPLNRGYGRPSGPWGRCLKAKGPYQHVVTELAFSPDRRFARLDGGVGYGFMNSYGVCILEKVDGRWRKAGCEVTLEEHIY